MNKRRIFAICCAAAMVVAAFALLLATGFACGAMLQGPTVVREGDALSARGYVRTDINYIMDICGVERTAGGRAKAYYAVAPIGNVFALVRFPASEYDNALAIETATSAYLHGESSTMGCHMVVTGAAVRAGDDEAALLGSWFEENAPWMSQVGVISAVEDYGVYLGDVVLHSGRIGRVSFGAAIAMTVAALALLVCAVAAFIFIGMGRFDMPRAKTVAEVAADEAAPTEESETETGPAPAEESEDGPTPEAAEEPEAEAEPAPAEEMPAEESSEEADA